MIAPLSSSHLALPSDPTHQIHPEPDWDIYREHDMGKPKEQTANGHKKKRLGESRERSASPKKVDRSKREEGSKKEFQEGKQKNTETRKTISAGKETVKQAISEARDCGYAEPGDGGGRTSRSTKASREGILCTNDIYKDATSEKKSTTALELSRSDSGYVSKVYGSSVSNSQVSAMEGERDAEAKSSEFHKEGLQHSCNPRRVNTTTRKATVSPGPWKIPGSDKLPSILKSGTSAMSR
ncbi:Hypothetical predicted protein [Pelobates cultripes]|uniref:Uncharacterized protein n=1 Tax=Pelobates cultripes TaxID=61616 RepID=A0AAD1VXS0_PELCU|nr:Hypothetical predicted protein [Pelobates cultripes]